MVTDLFVRFYELNFKGKKKNQQMNILEDMIKDVFVEKKSSCVEDTD